MSLDYNTWYRLTQLKVKYLTFLGKLTGNVPFGIRIYIRINIEMVLTFTDRVVPSYLLYVVN